MLSVVFGLEGCKFSSSVVVLNYCLLFIVVLNVIRSVSDEGCNLSLVERSGAGVRISSIVHCDHYSGVFCRSLWTSPATMLLPT